MEASCGTEWVISGAGSKTSGLEDRGTATRFESAENEGFLWVEIVDRTIHAIFYDKNETPLYETSWKKGP